MDATDTISSTVGEVRRANTGSFRYGKAAAALTAGDLCAFSTDGNYTATKFATAATTQALGVPQNDIAINQFGWFFIGEGTFRVNTAAGVTSGTKLHASATPGQVDSGAGVLIGAVAVANAPGGGGLTNAWAPAHLAANLYA
jgi:hypothetical protein